MLVARRGGSSVGQCEAPRLPLPGFPPSSFAVFGRQQIDGEQAEEEEEEEEAAEEEASEEEEEEDLRWLELHAFGAETTAAAGGEG